MPASSPAGETHFKPTPSNSSAPLNFAMRRFLPALLPLLCASLAAAAANPFFAMDNIARGGPDVAMLPAVEALGLKFFNGYHVLALDPAQPAPTAALRAVGYTGPVGFQGYNIKAEPRDVLARSIAAWRKFSAD